MTPVEIIALIFIVISIIKLITIAISPKAWYGSSNPLVKLVWNRISATIFSLIIGGVILYYLLAEISIVQLFVAVIFSFLLMIITVAPDIDKVLKAVPDQIEKKKGSFLVEYWPAIIAWVGLMVWTVWEILV